MKRKLKFGYLNLFDRCCWGLRVQIYTSICRAEMVAISVVLQKVVELQVFSTQGGSHQSVY